MKPHLCPRCNGERMVCYPVQSSAAPQRICPTCNGAGVLWEHDVAPIFVPIGGCTYKCDRCGVWWSGSHICPAIATTTAGAGP